MPTPAIPGYYYDEIKRKHFKILPNHVARASSKYSELSVKREAEDQVARKRHKLYNRIRLQTTIDRPRLRSHLLGGGVGLGREMGEDFDARSAELGAWAQGLGRRSWGSSRNSSALFAHDDITGALIFAGSGVLEALGTRRDVLAYAIPISKSEEWVDCSGGPIAIGLDSEICSLAISPSRVLMTTAMGGSRPACVHLTTLATPEVINDYVFPQSRSSSSPTISATYSQPAFSYVSDISTLLRSRVVGATFWSSSARPVTSHSDFALGTSSSTVLITSNESSWSFSQSMSFHAPYSDGNIARQEILAVDWLTENTLLNGCRSGHVYLWDVRCATSAGTSSPFKHASSIAHVRARNENMIVVAGIGNQLCTYDLRFLTYPYCSNSSAPTKPYLTFPGYRNRDMNGMAVGFDVKGNLIAAGTDDEMVQIFDGGTGRELQLGAGGRLGREKLGGTARCVKFVGATEWGDETRLYIAAGAKLEEWTW